VAAAFPGLRPPRRTPPWAIFDSSLREERHRAIEHLAAKEIRSPQKKWDCRKRNKIAAREMGLPQRKGLLQKKM
jgi:hypothetical protein